MAREDLHFRLRIPEDLKNKVEEAASTNRRSMTAEIVHRLEQSLNAYDDSDGTELVENILKRIDLAGLTTDQIKQVESFIAFLRFKNDK